MGAPIGNEYYKLRDTDGRDTEYTPKELEEKYNEYVDWITDNPLEEQQLFHYQGSIVKPHANKMRAFSLEGFCTYAKIVVNTFKNYEDREDFMTVTTRIRQSIELQQFEGAAGGFLNPSIMARKLGLTEKMETIGEVKISFK